MEISNKGKYVVIHRTKKGISYTSARARINMVPINISHIEKQSHAFLNLRRKSIPKFTNGELIKKKKKTITCFVLMTRIPGKTPFVRISIIQYFYVILAAFFLRSRKYIFNDENHLSIRCVSN
jgi:hypothetical protein